MKHSFGNYLRERRLAAGKSRKEIARVMGIAPSTYGAVEGGTKLPFWRPQWPSIERCFPISLSMLEHYCVEFEQKERPYWEKEKLERKLARINEEIRLLEQGKKVTNDGRQSI